MLKLNSTGRNRNVRNGWKADASDAVSGPRQLNAWSRPFANDPSAGPEFHGPSFDPWLGQCDCCSIILGIEPVEGVDVMAVRE